MFKNITRFEVIDESGRAYTIYDAVIDARIQDEGRTLKIFVNKNKECPVCEKGVVIKEQKCRFCDETRFRSLGTIDDGEDPSCPECKGTGKLNTGEEK